MWILVAVVSLLALTLARAQDNRNVTTNVCNLEKKTITCNNDSVIYIDSARFGRMRVGPGSCFASSGYGNVNCSADVRSYLERKCSGHRSCLLEQDPVLDRSNHMCPSDLKTYLEVTHHCLRVETPPRNFDSSKCNSNRYPLGTATSNGYMARIVTIETQIGSSTCPWSIEAKSGQTIQLTLYDFGLWQDPTATSAPGPGDSIGGRPMCPVYATITERTGAASAQTLCGGVQVLQRRVDGVDGGRVVYTSNSNSVQVAVTTTNNPTLEQFLLKYEVIGCADPDPPLLLAHVERSSDRLVVKCIKDNNDQDLEPKAWTIQCLDDGNWSIPLNQINCSTSPGLSYKKSPSDNVASGILLTVAISAAVIVAVLVITCGLFILYRRRASREEEESQIPLPGGEYRFMPTTGPTSGYGSWAPPEGAPYTPGDPAAPWAPIIAWPPGLERRPSADCLQERDYATTLQMRLNALPCSASSPSISSSHHVPASAAGPYGLLPYDPRTMMVYCPFHGTLTRVNGVEPGRARLRSEHRYEEVPLRAPACATETEADVAGEAENQCEHQHQQQEQEPLQHQTSGVYDELNY